MDETGFQIGSAQSTSVVTYRKKTAIQKGVPSNRQLATSIEAISAGGDWVKPPFLVVKGKVHLRQWYQVPELPGDTQIAVTDSGYSNDEVAFAWIKFFNENTKKIGSSAWRLLIIDGHTTHTTYEFIQYANDNNIEVFGLPPHLTHLLQPLDVVIFSPIKYRYSEAVSKLIRNGLDALTKFEFFTVINEVRHQTRKEKCIKSAFRKTGI